MKRLAVALIVGALWAAAVSAHEYPFEFDRALDADTFDGTIDLTPLRITVPIRIRLMCINAPESRGKNKSVAGVAMSEMVKGLGLTGGAVELVGRDAFGRYLAYWRPDGWDQSLNLFLYRNGAPLYGGLTRASKAECQRRFGIDP